MVNCVPVFLASDPEWAQSFRDAGLPIIGDDIKSQVGATIVHRTLARLFADRGVSLDRTYQLNTGGNTDFLNMLERSRLKSKKVSKTELVQSQLDERLEPGDIHIGPSDYVPWQHDNKVCFIRMEGRGFGDTPLEIELRLSVEDLPNSAGVVIDAIRCARLALDRGLAGPLEAPSAYYMKSPPGSFVTASPGTPATPSSTTSRSNCPTPGPNKQNLPSARVAGSGSRPSVPRPHRGFLHEGGHRRSSLRLWRHARRRRSGVEGTVPRPVSRRRTGHGRGAFRSRLPCRRRQGRGNRRRGGPRRDGPRRRGQPRSRASRAPRSATRRRSRRARGGAVPFGRGRCRPAQSRGRSRRSASAGRSASFRTSTAIWKRPARAWVWRRCSPS